ncbi:MAG: thiamine phosphate synthase [Micavibrio sp.]|nr:thiamine phosphate synthase [Micavibrio sp.]
MKNFDLSVYFVADPSLCGERDIVDVVMAAAKGGATLIQYRNKDASQMQVILAEAAMLQEWLSPLGVPLLINDYVDVAFAVGAAGVHLGQGDDNPAEARARLGNQAIIGQTAFTPEHIAKIDPQVIDYIGTGPFYETKTDKGKPVLGAEKFAEMVKLSPVPVVGIGGITPNNAAAVIAAGADGVAMMRSVSEADNPENAARKFVEALA